MADEDTQETAEQPQTLTADSAAEELDGLLADDPFTRRVFGDNEDVEGQDPEEGDVEEPELEDEDFEEIPDEDLEAAEDFEDEDPDELTDEEAGRADDEASDEDLYTVKVDGEELEVTLDEALAGYQRTAAFTRKAQELAREREAVQERAQELADVRAQYAEKLQVVEQALQVEEPNWDQLKQQDPEKYARARAAFEERREQLEAIEAEIQQAQAEAQQTHEQALQEHLKREQEKLVAKIPEWVDPEKAQAEKEKLAKGAQDIYGFTPQDLSKVTDHRLLLLLRDGIRYNEMQSKAGEAKKEARSKKRKSKTLKPGSKQSSKKNKSSQKSRAALKRLARSGRVDDAAAALDSLLPDDVI